MGRKERNTKQMGLKQSNFDNEVSTAKNEWKVREGRWCDMMFREKEL
jgi:hypothetical protein